MLPRQVEMDENTPFISKSDKSSVIGFELRFNQSENLSDGPSGSRHNSKSKKFNFLVILISTLNSYPIIF